MVEGLDIDDNQFMKMKPAERDLLIFKNLKNYCQVNDSSRFHTKVQYVWLATITAIGIWIIKKLTIL